MQNRLQINAVEIGHYDIPLPKVLTDSTHGEMRHFALLTVRLRTDSGAEGLGYTYTVGKTGGAAVRAHLEHDLRPLLLDEDPRQVERLWQRMWQALHYVGRGGAATFAISAVDVALWDLKAKLAGEPLWRFLGGYDPRVKVYAGRDRPQDAAQGASRADPSQPRARLPRDQDEGRPRTPRRRRRACRRHEGAAGAGNAVDGRRQHALERRGGCPCCTALPRA